jgi:tripartite-type tricarboxylate transporter receptor subunit TctC
VAKQLAARSRHPVRAIVLAATAAVLAATSASAQSPADKYPEKPIKIIVPFAPGGSTDILARVLGQKMTESWGQPVIIETRPGAATMIGTQAAAKAEPDGYTLIIVVSNHTTNPALNPSMPYDAVKDFEPVSLLGRAPIVPYVNPSFPPTNVKELVALAKAKPGTINFGSAGPASMTHLTAEQFKLQAGIDMTHVNYRGGTPALNDVLAGQIPMTWATVTQALPQYQGGLVRALGVTRPSAMLDPQRADLPRAGVRPDGDGMVRSAGARGYAQADRGEAQRRDAADPGAAARRASDGDRAAGLAAGRAGQLHPQRDRSLDPGDQEARAQGGVSIA